MERIRKSGPARCANIRQSLTHNPYEEAYEVAGCTEYLYFPVIYVKQDIPRQYKSTLLCLLRIRKKGEGR